MWKEPGYSVIFVAFLENLIFVALNLLITWKFKFQTHGNPELEQYSLEPVTQTRNLIQFIFNRSMMMFGHLNLINADKKDETKSEMSRISWPEWTINVTTQVQVRWYSWLKNTLRENWTVEYQLLIWVCPSKQLNRFKTNGNFLY